MVQSVGFVTLVFIVNLLPLVTMTLVLWLLAVITLPGSLFDRLFLGFLVELLLEQTNQVVAPFLDICWGTSLNYPVEQEVGTVPDLIFQKVPVAIGVLEHTQSIDLVFSWVEVKWVLL